MYKRCFPLLTSEAEAAGEEEVVSLDDSQEESPDNSLTSPPPGRTDTDACEPGPSARLPAAAEPPASHSDNRERPEILVPSLFPSPCSQENAREL